MYGFDAGQLACFIEHTRKVGKAYHPSSNPLGVCSHKINGPLVVPLKVTS